MAVLLAAACWGASGIFVKLIMAAGPVSSLCLAFWRDFATFAVFSTLAMGMDRNRIMVRRSDWPSLAGMGICLGVFLNETLSLVEIFGALVVVTGVIILLVTGARNTPARTVSRR